MDHQLQLATRNLIARGTNHLSQEQKNGLIDNLLRDYDTRNYALQEAMNYSYFEATVEYLREYKKLDDIIHYYKQSLWIGTHRVVRIWTTVDTVCQLNLFTTRHAVFTYAPPDNACKKCLETKSLDPRYGEKYKHLLELKEKE